ncbi:hypothetical protein BC936DRAFT_142243, partial [Jimgerdemannia flammicorona]
FPSSLPSLPLFPSSLPSFPSDDTHRRHSPTALSFSTTTMHTRTFKIHKDMLYQVFNSGRKQLAEYETRFQVTIRISNSDPYKTLVIQGNTVESVTGAKVALRDRRSSMMPWYMVARYDDEVAVSSEVAAWLADEMGGDENVVEKLEEHFNVSVSVVDRYPATVYIRGNGKEKLRDARSALISLTSNKQQEIDEHQLPPPEPAFDPPVSDPPHPTLSDITPQNQLHALKDFPKGFFILDRNLTGDHQTSSDLLEFTTSRNVFFHYHDIFLFKAVHLHSSSQATTPTISTSTISWSAPALRPPTTSTPTSVIPRPFTKPPWKQFCRASETPSCLATVSALMHTLTLQRGAHFSLRITLGTQYFTRISASASGEMTLADWCCQRLSRDVGQSAFLTHVEEPNLVVLEDFLFLEGFTWARQEAGRKMLKIAYKTEGKARVAFLQWSRREARWRPHKLRMQKHPIMITTFVQADPYAASYRLVVLRTAAPLRDDADPEFTEYLNECQGLPAMDERRDRMRFLPKGSVGIEWVRDQRKRQYRCVEFNTGLGFFGGGEDRIMWRASHVKPQTKTPITAAGTTATRFPSS